MSLDSLLTFDSEALLSFWKNQYKIDIIVDLGSHLYFKKNLSFPNLHFQTGQKKCVFQMDFKNATHLVR